MCWDISLQLILYTRTTTCNHCQPGSQNGHRVTSIHSGHAARPLRSHNLAKWVGLGAVGRAGASPLSRPAGVYILDDARANVLGYTRSRTRGQREAT